MKNLSKLIILTYIFLLLGSCTKEKTTEEVLEKNYSYNVDAIYQIPSSSRFSKSHKITNITYVIPTIYDRESYDFKITSLSDDGSDFNVSFEKYAKSYSTDFHEENNKIYLLSDKGNKSNTKDSFLSCVGSHEGTALGFLTGAYTGITSFIPFLQPIVFACAAETAAIASIVTADWATT